MTERPSRVVDAHVHLWDPSNTEWYPYLSQSPPRMGRLFDLPTYRAESAGWNVEKIVNVAAATGRSSVEETLKLDGLAEAGGSGPHAIIGGLPPAETAAEAIGLLDRQMQASRFRGVRPMGGLDRPLPAPEVLRAMEERGLIFEVMTHPDRLADVAEGLRGFDDLTVVVEHTGWPRDDTSDEWALWQDGLDALADLGDQVHCKLSGLTMPFESVAAHLLEPWIEYALEVFGPHRCFFASNFPVDSVHGTFDELYTTFSELTAGLSDSERDRLFAGNAERLYRI